MHPTPIAVPERLHFWPLFAVALLVRLLTVALGIALIPVQPPTPVRVAGVSVAGFPADLRPGTPTTERFRDEILAGPARVVEPWYRWDALWMANVATNGYANTTDESGARGVAFMPAMPAVMAAAAAVGLDLFWAGLLAANLAGAVGAAVFATTAAQLTESRALGVRAFVLLLAFPTAMFFSAPYNESFGLLFTALALSAWVNARPVRCGVWAAFGSLARLTGVAVGVAAIASWALEERSRTAVRRAAVVAVGCFAGVAIFWGYLWWTVGDAGANLESHKAWGRKGFALVNPWYALQSVFHPAKPVVLEGMPLLLEAASAAGFALLGVRAWKRRGAFWGVLTLVPIAQMLMSGTLLSGHRVILAALPGFIELADLLRDRVRFRLVVVGFAVAQLFLLNRFVHWQWTG